MIEQNQSNELIVKIIFRICYSDNKILFKIDFFEIHYSSFLVTSQRQLKLSAKGYTNLFKFIYLFFLQLAMLNIDFW